MLSRTLATTFAPGINRKHDLAGANWTYLLPSLELEHIVSVGVPPQTTLTTLSRISKQVTIVCDGAEESRRALDVTGKGHSQQVAVIQYDGCGLPMADESIELLLIANRAGLLKISSVRSLREELQRVLNIEGFLYFELSPLTRIFQRKALRVIARQFGEPQLFWLTPWHGEMQTAVPVSDRRTIDRFLHRKLHSPSLNVSVLKHMIRRQMPSQNGSGPGGVTSSKRKEGGLQTDLLAQARARLQGALRGVAARTVSAATKVEKWLLKRNRLVRRQGGFISVEAAVQAQKPPRYLRSIAQSAGIEIEDYRWGFSARGRYSSRKLLFFLFQPGGRNNASHGSNYIVKMVRDSSFNRRLENEYQALVTLEQKGIGGIPKAVFHGHHKGLAIVGESLVEGVPFRRKADATAECDYTRAAVDWLTHLGMATACSSAESPRQVALGLGELLERFAELYRPPEDEHAFLSAQIETISRSQEAFPIVFQHGDPGAWNIFVTRDKEVAFLDWEAAEPQGMPLWDLFYFLRSVSTWAARENGIRDTLQGLSDQFLADGPMGRFIVESTESYCQRVGLPWLFIEPLFYTCWMHRALKQATSLRVAELAGGHYVNLLRLTIRERQKSPILRRLFSGSGATELT